MRACGRPGDTRRNGHREFGLGVCGRRRAAPGVAETLAGGGTRMDAAGIGGTTEVVTRAWDLHRYWRV